MANGKTILILGGGIGGLVTSTLLRKKLPQEHKVVLVERESNYVFQPSLLWLMTGTRNTEEISRPLSKLDKIGIERIQGNVERIDPEHKTIQVDGQQLSADYLIIALGAELAPETIPGLNEVGYNIYTLTGAKSLRDARLTLREGRIAVLVSSIPFKCPAAPYEAAMLLEYDYRKRKIRDAVKFDLYSAEPGPMGVAGPEVSKQVRQMVEAKNIEYHPEHAITKVEVSNKQLHFSNGTQEEFDLLAYVPPHRAPQVVIDAGLAGESGWVPVNRDSLETKFPGIYAIGDVTGIPLSMGKPLPKAGVFAHGEGEIVANNLIEKIAGKGTPKMFDGHGECFIETGDGKAGFGQGNFFAEPTPQVRLNKPSRVLHLGKVAYEKYWLFERF